MNEERDNQLRLAARDAIVEASVNYKMWLVSGDIDEHKAEALEAIWLAAVCLYEALQ